MTPEEYGFVKNTARIEGFVPHYKKENYLLFEIGKNYWCHKIVTIGHRLKNTHYIALGYIVPGAPRAAAMDWVTGDPTQVLIRFNEEEHKIQIARWAENHNELEWVDTPKIIWVWKKQSKN